MTPELLLGEEERVAEGHLEDPAAGGDQPHLGLGELLAERGRQTGGPWLVVSDRAEFDGQAHGSRRKNGSSRPDAVTSHENYHPGRGASPPGSGIGDTGQIGEPAQRAVLPSEHAPQ